MQVWSYAAAALAAAAAGAVNSLAGGGTLITFPVLIGLGLSPVAANVSNTVALLPGYLGGAWAQREVLSMPEQRGRLVALLPASLLGGLGGAILLGLGGEGAFTALVPYLILFATALLAFGEPIKKLLSSGRPFGVTEKSDVPARVPTAAKVRKGIGPWTVVSIAAASVYGGYFGAGVSVILLAVLGLAFEDPLPELNALKQAIALACNLAAAVSFAIGGKVFWPMVFVMSASALAGGAVGGALAGRIKGPVLRVLIVAIGLAVGLYYLFRNML